MKKLGAFLGSTLAAAVILVIVIGAVWLGISGRSFPDTRGRQRLPGLDGEVEITRDAEGVPHIRATTLHDLYYAQGYVHAQDRFWQMEFWRRIGAGRLSELFGRTSLPIDIYVRTMGFARIAEQEYQEADPDTRLALDAYAQGVNAYIGGRPPGRLGLEFALLRLQGVKIEVEPWRPAHSLTWLKIMSQDLGGNMETELLRLDVIRWVGTTLASSFFAPYRGDTMPTILSDTEAGIAGDDAAAAVDPDAALAGMDIPTTLVGGFDPSTPLALGRGTGIGSNNWVVSGRYTASGKPLLANDPHLGIQMPSIWYEVGLHAPGMDVRGFSFAGAPGVIVGHNAEIAWGVTNVGPDVQDLYVERLNPERPDQYEVNGVWRDMMVRYEEIRIQGEDEPYTLPIRATRHGPVVSDHGAMLRYTGFGLRPMDVFPRDLTLTALSVRWTALQPNTTLRAVLMINRARGYEEFRDALRWWDIPSQNFVYADTQGNIAYQTPGLIPIRRSGDGTYPVPGWTDDYEWTGYIPFEELPHALNPGKGYIVTANNPVVSSRYPHLIASEFAYGYRARRITDRIEEGVTQGTRFTTADMASIQADTRNLFALELLPYLEAVHPAEGSASRAWEMIRGWDGRMETESTAATVFAYTYVALVEETYRDQLPEELWTSDKALGRSERLMNSLVSLLPDPANPWWDDARTMDQIETRDIILTRALTRAWDRAVKELGRRTTGWRWGRVHRATFRNQTLGSSGIGLVEAMFNRGPVEVRGGMEQVSCTDFDLGEPFDVWAVSSLRQVVDLGDFSRSLAIHTTGQSGHARHPHYADFIQPWASHEYHPMRWTAQDAERDGTERLLLIPRG